MQTSSKVLQQDSSNLEISEWLSWIIWHTSLNGILWHIEYHKYPQNQKYDTELYWAVSYELFWNSKYVHSSIVLRD